MTEQARQEMIRAAVVATLSEMNAPIPYPDAQVEAIAAECRVVMLHGENIDPKTGKRVEVEYPAVRVCESDGRVRERFGRPFSIRELVEEMCNRQDAVGRAVRWRPYGVAV